MAHGEYTEKRDLKSVGVLLGRLDIELTERCNNNCIHCCINLPRHDAGAMARELSTDEWKDVLGQAAGLGIFTIRFTGGEPLLRDDFEEIYLHARRLGMRVLIFTNGCLITPHLARLFSAVPPLQKIEITVYGMRKESYEAVSRVPGSFADFWKGIKCLLENNVPFGVKGALLPENEQDVAAFEEWAGTLPGMDRPPPYSIFFEMRGRRDSERDNARIRTLRPSPDKGLAFISRDPGKYHRDMVQFCSKFMGPPGDRLFACGAGRSVCVDAYGKVQPCLSLRAPDLSYDLRTGTLREALAAVRSGIQDLKAGNPKYLERCARCFLKGLCEQCPARSWSETGTLDTPVDYLCEIAHAQARYLGLLGEGESAWEVEDGPDRVKRMGENVR